MNSEKTFRVSTIYTSHMVLQRNKIIQITGSAEPGEKITGAFDGENAASAADENGDWMLTFAPRPACCEPKSLTIAGAGRKVTFEDVVIGDVWLASGQSNMGMPVFGGQVFYQLIEPEYRELQQKAEDPLIRYFSGSWSCNPAGPVKEFSPNARWQRCNPNTVNSMYALGYFFAANVSAQTGVPVGIVQIAVGATGILSWISRKSFEKAGFSGICRMIENAPFSSPEDFQKKYAELQQLPLQNNFAWLEKFLACDPAASSEALASYAVEKYDDSAWDHAELPFKISKPGVVWLRAELELPPNVRSGKLRLGVINDCDESFVNGVKIGATGVDTPASWTVDRNYPVKGGVLHAGKNVIAVRVMNLYNTGSVTAEHDAFSFLADDGREFEGRNLRAKLEFYADIDRIGQRPAIEYVPEEPRLEFDWYSANFPATLFNALVSPWRNFPFLGAIWYQGCHNAGDPNYFEYNKLLIDCWREELHNPEMPFIMTELAGFSRHCPDNRGPEDEWKHAPIPRLPALALLREMQSALRNYPGTYVTTAADIGDQYDIHPRNKKDLGERFARLALRYVYQMDVPARGPEFDRMEFEKNGIRVYFRFAENGLRTRDGKAPRGFILRSESGAFVWADAKLEGNTAFVSKEGVRKPTEVRYAFADYCDANLCNAEGLPAIPFRNRTAFYKI